MFNPYSLGQCFTNSSSTCILDIGCTFVLAVHPPNTQFANSIVSITFKDLATQQLFFGAQVKDPQCQCT